MAPRSVLLLLVLAACDADPAKEGLPSDDVAPALLRLSDPSFEFGDLDWEATDSRILIASNDGGRPLGIGAVHIGDDPTSFTVAWDPCAVTCGGEPVSACDASLGIAVLDPGCELPLTVTYTADTAGDAFDAVIVETTADPSAARWDADPLHAYGVAYVHGATTQRDPRILLSPRSYDFGFVYPGVETTPARFEISNIGDADLTVSSLALSGCDATFSLTTTLATPFVLAPAESTLAEVSFAPTTTDSAYCQLLVTSDDDVYTEVDATISANTGSSANTAPTVTITSPASGSGHDTAYPLRVELTLADAEQPASSLTCSVESRVLGGGTLATCTPADSAGRVVLDIAGASLPVGIDTLGVTVVDASGGIAYTSVSIRFDTPAPADDDDGDGFGVPDDCDELDATVYPKAMELADALDNDCDGIIDEGTANYDDDGDAVTEADGDCDDGIDDIYPGAPERGDGRDNDCDGTTDEDTSLSDDDGDGFAEVNNDCDDSDAGVNPAAEEACDGQDNDCDGFRDDAPEGCDARVGIVGDVLVFEQTAVREGDTVWIEAETYTTDGAPLTYAWSADDGSFVDEGASRATYTAGAVATEGGRAVTSVYLLITHPDGHQDWAGGTITVFDAAADLY